MFKFKTRFGEYDKCEFIKEGEGTHTRYSIFSKDEENYGPIIKLNLPGYTDDLKDDYRREDVVAVFDYSENKGTMDFLEKIGVAKRTFGYLQSGFVEIPVVEIDAEKLMKLNECKEISFIDGITLDKNGKEPK